MKRFQVEFKWYTFRKDVMIDADCFDLFLGSASFYRYEHRLVQIAELQGVKNIYLIPSYD